MPVHRILRLLVLLQIFTVTASLADNPSDKEFRGIWIATINNIDWPSAPGLPVEVQKKELTALIERIKKLNLNAVIFQVRPAADAFYPSDTEPWSGFLTGRQGFSPASFFDPLAYAIELCHSKKMELHAWFNPFRVRNLGYYKLYPGSFAARNPQYTYIYDNKLFLDPGFPQVRTHLIKVIMEVVRKYNIDAVHLDDYFYPYPVKGKKLPDAKTFHKYGKTFYPNKLNDWRRDNINQFIANLHDSIKTVKPDLKLGISPFGIWRNKSEDPNGSPGARGTTSYDNLYADVYKWLSSDWIDYILPQLYWEQGNRFGDFTVLAKWWNDHSFGKPLYLGQALYKSTGTTKVFANPKEISEQIGISRKFENVGGFALYSASHLAKLPENKLNELNLSILPLMAEQSEQVSPLVIAQKETHPRLPGIVADKVLTADKNGISKLISTTYQSVIDSTLSVPEQFSVIKSREGWQLSWKISSPDQAVMHKYTVMIFERADGGGYLKKVLTTTEDHQFLIPRKSAFNPAKVFFAVVSVDQNGFQSAFPDLFKIRGNRIIKVTKH